MKARAAPPPAPKTARSAVGDLVSAGEDGRVFLKLEHEGGVPAERVARGLGERVQRLRQREGRAEHLGDPVEAALHLRLALPLLEALGVVERERGKARKRLDDLDVALVELAGLARADAEDAPTLSEPGDRRAHDVVEDRVGRARRRLLGARRSRGSGCSCRFAAPVRSFPRAGSGGRRSTQERRRPPGSGGARDRARGSSSRRRRRR